MKKILYAGFVLLALGGLFLSNSSGAGLSQGLRLTGAPGDELLANGNPKTCQFCHNNGPFNPTARLEVLNAAGTAAVTSYQPGTEYTIQLTITASGSPGGYGFQMIDIRKSNNTPVKGFTAAQATGIQLTKSGSGANERVYAEQSERLTTNTINVKWKAPSPGIGTVVFYAVGNAVNGTGSSGGDNGTTSVNIELRDATAVNINELSLKVNMDVSPNPVTEGVNLTLNAKEPKALQVRVSDITGRAIISENWIVTTGANQRQLDLSRLATGAYMIQVLDKNDVISKKILKL